ncbi:MAG: hypothetical protein GY852_09520 [bacterium]|nr:hypothetical protein [bacterium]
MKLYILLMLASVLLLSGCTIQESPAPEPPVEINSFDECAAAGYPIMESYPRQCAVPGGETFTEEVDIIPPGTESSCQTNSDCACGIHIEFDRCFYGNKEYVDTSKQCPDFCTGIAGHLEVQCINNTCTQVSKLSDGEIPSSFDECVAAGNPVMESYPEQCAVPGGGTFTRTLSDEECQNADIDHCFASCRICPPCPECSSLSCRSAEFCESMGFTEEWSESIEP